MKAILEFDLPKERDDHQLAMEGSRWRNVCYDINEWLRKKLKHEDLPEWDQKLYEEVKDMVSTTIDWYELNLE